MKKPPKFPAYDRGQGNVFDWIMVTAQTVREERRTLRDEQTTPVYTAPTRGRPTQTLVPAHPGMPSAQPPVQSPYHELHHALTHKLQAGENSPQSNPASSSD